MHPFFRIFLLLLLSSTALLRAQTSLAAGESSAPTDDTNPVTLEKMVVADKLDRAREDIVPSLGASSYEITAAQISLLPAGADAAFNQVLLRAPGVAQDSFGQVHIRGEHGNLQYRINDVLLPEGISGFGQELDSRFVGSMQVLTGSLPAQYGYRTSGVVDIHTKSGHIAQASALSLYGGSHDTVRPSAETGGTQRNATYYVSASYDSNTLGIENPTSSRDPIHDRTQQFKGFGYYSLELTRCNESAQPHHQWLNSEISDSQQSRSGPSLHSRRGERLRFCRHRREPAREKRLRSGRLSKDLRSRQRADRRVYPL